MEIVINNQIEIRSPTKELKDWIEKELFIINPEYKRKKRMNLWIGNTPKTLNLYKKNGNIYYLPYGCLKDITPMILEADVTYQFKLQNYIKYEDVSLYDYQEKVVRQAINNLYGVIQAPAGSGKTQMGISIISKLGKKALWITHTQDLLTQSKKRAEIYFGKKGLGTITGGKIDIGERVTFATVQTLVNIDLEKYKDEWGVIITDECHRLSGSPTKITQFYKVLNSLAAPHKYGLSATVHRADGMVKSIFSIIGNICASVDKEEVGNKIMKVGIKPIRTGIGYSEEVQNPDGTMNYQKLINFLTESDFRNKIIIRQIKNNVDHSSLILSDRVEHLEKMMKLLDDKKSCLIDGKTKKEVREKILDDIAKGKKKYLFATYKLAKEGLDLPILSRLYLTTPQKDYAIVVQSIGRIARVLEGKPNPIAYDFVDNMRYLERSYKARWTTYNKIDCYLAE